MKKLLLIGGGTILLLAAMAFGTFFASPLLASANSNSVASSAAGTPNPYCVLYVKDLANRLHVSVTTLQQDSRAALTDVLNRMVKDGKLTPSQAKALEHHAQSNPNRLCAVASIGLAHFVVGQFLRKYHTQIEDSIATGLHMTSTQLTSQLRSGKSLSQIAASQGVSNAQLRTIVSNAIQSALTSAVGNGDLTQTQANAISQFVKSHPAVLDYILNAHYNEMMNGMMNGMTKE